MNSDGLGDKVSSDFVDYCPWILDGDMMPGTPSCHYIEGNGMVEATSSFTGGTMTITAQGGHTICTLKYAENPAGPPNFTPLGNFWDVYLDRDSGVNGIQALFGPVGAAAPPSPTPTPTPTPTATVLASGPRAIASAAAPASSGTAPGIYYWDGDTWRPCSNQTVVDGFVEVTINNSTSPSLSDLTGQIFADGILVLEQYGGGGPTVGGEIIMVNKAQLISRWLNLPMRLMVGFAF